MTFSFVSAGWEGSAHDSKVLSDALTKGLTIYESKCYLGDAGYCLKNYWLTPDRGVRYYLKEWGAGNQKPTKKEELFNLRHSSLRNVIERSFGVVKKRFLILTNMQSFEYQFQIVFVLSCFMLHNFIKVNQGYDDKFDNLHS